MRLRRFLVGMTAMAGALAASPLAAAPKGAPQEDLRRVASTFADCVVRVNAPLARGVVLQNLTAAQILKDPEARRLIDGMCLKELRSDDAIGREAPVGMRFEGDLFRYNLADALVRRDYPALRSFDFASVPPLQHHDPAPLDPVLASGTDRKAKEAQEGHAAAMAISVFSRFGECVCRRDPDNAQKLILSAVVTDAENAALSALTPALGQCLADGQMRLSREVVRGLLALNFYRLAGAPAGADVTILKGGTDA